MQTSNSFPDHNIDPRRKDKKWCLQFAKAAWNDCETAQPKTMFYHYRGEYDKIKSYALGRQDTNPYKKPMHVDEQSNTTFAVLDFKVLPIVKKQRQIALGRLQKSDYNIVVTPIDPLARAEAEKYFASVKAKIMLRDEVKKQSPELADSPVLQADPREPLDLEELEMQMEFGYKHNLAMNCEQGIQLIFNQNDITTCRQKVIEDLFDYGVAVYKDWMEPGGKVRFRRCDVRDIITNYCRYDDFKDLLYCGEVVDMTWYDFREQSSGQFDEDEYEKIFNASKTQGDNFKYSANYNRVSNKFKIKVLDIEWFSIDEFAYEDKVNKLGNPVFGKTDWNKKDKVKRHKRKVIYRAKWIVDTDYIYDFGLSPFQKRDRTLTNTDLSYHIVATNLHEMKASGVMEDIIPIADQMAIAWLKLQNIRNSLLPYYIDIDLDALEDVDLSKGGNTLTPKDLLQMMFQSGILVSRRKGLSQNNPNYKTLEFVQTNYGTAIAEAWNDLSMHMQLLRDATGFNEVTDGSTPNPKNLNSTNAAAIEGTNNALYHIYSAEKGLLLKLAHAVLTRMRRAVKMGKVEGYIQALSSNAVKYIQVSPDIDLHDYGMLLEDKPQPEQKQNLLNLMQKGMMEGSLDATDMILVENTSNLKQAEQLLAYRIKKRKEEAQQYALQQQQQTGNIQIQSAQAAVDAEIKRMQEEYRLKGELMDKQKAWDERIKKLELGAKVGMNTDNNTVKKEVAKAKDTEEGELPETPLPQAAA
jgi:hypothetical protein